MKSNGICHQNINSTLLTVLSFKVHCAAEGKPLNHPGSTHVILKNVQLKHVI